MNKLFVILSIASFLSCNRQKEYPQVDIQTEEKVNDHNLENTHPTVNSEQWKITEIKKQPHLDKILVYVELSNKLDELEIVNIAYKIRAEQNLNKLYIFYSIKNGDKNWANSHFNPALTQVNIVGSTEEQDNEVLKRPEVKGEIEGKWKSDNSLSGSVLILHKVKGVNKMTIQFSDGGSSEEIINIKKKKGETIYSDNNSFGEYYVIEKNGNLGMYGENGKFDEAVKL